MKNRILRGLGLCLAITLAVFLCTTPAMSAGFGIYEWSNRGDSVGGSLLGTADDASTVAYNPAGIAHFSNWQMLFGVTMITPMSDVKTTNMYDGKTSTASTESTSHAIPHFYVAGPVWEGTDFERLSFGLGVFSRYGLATEFYQGWAGRYNSYKAEIKAYSVNPNLALKINDQWSVAGGIEIMMFNVDLRQRIDATKIFAAQGQLGALAAQGIPTTINDPNTSIMDVDQKLSGQSHGFGFNLAVMYEPNEQWGFGATYRSEVKQDVGGQVHFQKSPTVAALLPNLYNFTNADAEITLPDQISFGVNYNPMESLMIGVSAIYTRWSSYDRLKVLYDTNQVGVTEVSSQKDWDDVWRFQLGAEYQLLDWLALRGSYVYDESPINDAYADYLLPANDRQLASFGLGFQFNPTIRLDINYTYLWMKDRDVASRQIASGVLASEYSNGNAQIYGATLSFSF